MNQNKQSNRDLIGKTKKINEPWKNTEKKKTGEKRVHIGRATTYELNP